MTTRLRLNVFFLIGLSASLPALLAAGERGERYALLVGIGEYRSDSGLGNLKYPESDMQALRDTFKDIGFEEHNIRLMVKSARDERLNPRKENILNELKLLLDNKRPEDVVVVVLSGHGLQPREKDEAFFCPSDANLTKMDTWLDMDLVFKMMKACNAGGKLLIADCCRDDPKLKNMRGLPSEVTSVTRPLVIKPPQTVSVLLSCGNGQAAYEEEDLKGGVFTHFLIKGLKGKAALNGEVEVKTLASYLQRAVYDYVSAKRGAQQNPTFKSDSDLPLILARTQETLTSKISSNPINDARTRDAIQVDDKILALFEEAYTAWDFDHDYNRARSLYQAVIKRLNETPETRNAPELYFAQLALEHPGHNPQGSWARHAKFADEAVKGFRAAGNKRWMGIALQQHAGTFMPNSNPPVSWTTAIALLEEAYQAELEAGDKREQVDCLFHLATSYDLSNNPAGSKVKAGEYYEQAAKLAELNVKESIASGNRKLLAQSLLIIANAKQPLRNPAGDYEKAATAARDAAEIFKELGQIADQAECLQIQALSMQPGANLNPNGDATFAAKAFIEAAAAYEKVKHDADEALCLFNAGFWLRPNNNKDSNWKTAETAFQKSVLFYERTSDKNGLGGALLQQGYCMTKQNNDIASPAAKAIFQRAAKLLRETNDLTRAKEAESWLK